MAIRLSTVNGKAFIWDTEVDLSPYQNGHYKITVTDNASKSAVGWIKAEVPGGESYGSELVSNGSMESGDPPTGWTAFASATLSQVADERTGGSGSYSIDCVRGTNNVVATQDVSSTNGTLYDLRFWAKRVSASTGVVVSVFTVTPPQSTSSSWEGMEAYITRNHATNSAIWLMVTGATGVQGRIDDVSVREVTDIPTTGAYIVSAQAGTTRNWESIDTGFNPNYSLNTQTITGGAMVMGVEVLKVMGANFTDVMGAR